MKISSQQIYRTINNFDVEYESLSQFTNVANFSQGGELHIVQVKHQQIQEGYYEDNKVQHKTLILNKKQLDEVVHEPQKMFANRFVLDEPVLLVKKDFLPAYAQGQFKFAELMNLPKQDETRSHSALSDNFLSTGLSPDAEFIQFVKHPSGHHVFRDNQGNLFMEPFHFDYVGANLDNGEYHLDELIEHLMKRDDIAFVLNSQHHYSRQSKGLLYAPLTGKETGIDKIIDDIPGYNREEGRDETISIIYFPKMEDLKKILQWNSAQETDKGIYNLEKFIVRKILETEKFLKSPPAHVIEEVPKRKFKR